MNEWIIPHYVQSTILNTRDANRKQMGEKTHIGDFNYKSNGNFQLYIGYRVNDNISF